MTDQPVTVGTQGKHRAGSRQSQPTRNHRTVTNREFIGMPCRGHRDDRVAEDARDFAAHGDMKRKERRKGRRESPYLRISPDNKSPAHGEQQEAKVV